MSKKNKDVSLILNYTENFIESFIEPFAIIRCISISAFASLPVIPIGIASYVIGLKVYAITAIKVKVNN